jgi:hypothetical protein
MPCDKPFVDFGDVLDAAHLRMIEQAVAQANREIERALRQKQTPAIRKRIAALQSQEYLVEIAYRQVHDASTDVLDAQAAFGGSWARKNYPDAYTCHTPTNWIYASTHAWLDPRKLVTAWRSGTIRAYGVYFGTDKLSHFHHMGRFYYSTWRENLAKGMSDEEAVRNVIMRYSAGGPLGENGLLGFIATGVYSNADLVANYMGFKFYRNLTEPVMLKGREHPPLCVREGEFWRVNTHVRPESGWFGAFVSDHWNEALNPNVFDVTIRADAGKAIEERAEQIIKFYTQRDGRPDDPAYYKQLAQELSTYYGEQYGHSNSEGGYFTIGDTAYPRFDRTPSR